MLEGLPGRANVVIIGGGIIGCSVAYHLARRGCTDVVLLERRQLTCGTTWHAAGLVGQLRATHNLTRLAQYTTELYGRLEAETGHATGFRQTGSLAVASTADRLEELQRGASMARSFGLDVEILTPDDIRGQWPLARTDDLHGGIFLAKDGQTNPVDTTRALARGAKSLGARIVENCQVTKVLVNDGRAAGVVTDKGVIIADAVVNCGGMWAHEIGARIDVSIPLHAAEHFYVVTESVAGLDPGIAVLRDPDGCAYFKEDTGKLLIGWFEPVAKAWGYRGIPQDFAFDRLPDDFAHIEPMLERAINRVPALEHVGIQLFFNGPESFTPDDRYLLGETPEVQRFYVAAGFNSIGIQSAGGAGKVLADWIVDGHPPVDLWDVDVRRCMPFQRNTRYLRERTSESPGMLYAMHWPHRQAETARGVRRSALHDRLASAGASFGETAGFERPEWFDQAGASTKCRYSFGRPGWFENSAAEHRAVREAVGLFDQSSFAKFSVEGRDAHRALDRLCTSDITAPVGKIVYTNFLNERGGIEADVTVTREAEDRFLVITSCATQTRVLAWLRRNIPRDAHTFITDVSAAFSVIGLMGPASRNLLASLTDADLSNEAFPFGLSRLIDLAYARARASRISYVGELGWELYIPTDFVQSVYDSITAVGPLHGLRYAGYHAMNSLRLEKGYRHWGHDISDEDTPLEAGLAFVVDWKKPGGFVGLDALTRQQAAGVRRRLVTLSVAEDDRLLHRDEPIWRDGELVGRTTSAGFGHTLGRQIALGYVANPRGLASPKWLLAGNYEVEVAGHRLPAAATLSPLYDPHRRRILS